MGSPAAVTYGPIFIGMVFNILLYGIMITQTYMYFDMFRNDKLWIKLFVTLLFICDTLNSAFDISFVYIPLVNNFGNEQALAYASWVFSTDPALTAIIACMVQLFFAWRVKVLSKSWLLVACIAFCSVCQCLGGLATSIACRIIPEFVHFQKFEVVVIIWLACSAAADMIITLSLVWNLKKHKTGLTGTDDVVNKIIRLTVQTGMVTTVCAIIDLILFLVTPAGLHLIFNLPLSKLYTNSLMSSLNSRVAWTAQLSRLKPVSRSRSDWTESEGTSPIFSSHVNYKNIVQPPQRAFVDMEGIEMHNTDCDMERYPW